MRLSRGGQLFITTGGSRFKTFEPGKPKCPRSSGVDVESGEQTTTLPRLPKDRERGSGSQPSNGVTIHQTWSRDAVVRSTDHPWSVHTLYNRRQICGKKDFHDGLIDLPPQPLRYCSSFSTKTTFAGTREVLLTQASSLAVFAVGAD